MRVKIREQLAENDYRDPGPYDYPPGTVAHDVEAAPVKSPASRDSTPLAPGGGGDHHHH
jgi:hypothetical protein